MSKRVIELFLFDAYIAILKIEDTFNRFSDSASLFQNYNAWDSVIREFEILGEATRHLIDSKILTFENRVVVDFRNLLIHNYFGIDSEEVWNVIKDDLPNFKENILSKIHRIEINLKSEIINSYIDINQHLDFIKTQLFNLKK